MVYEHKSRLDNSLKLEKKNHFKTRAGMYTNVLVVLFNSRSQTSDASKATVANAHTKPILWYAGVAATMHWPVNLGVQ